MVNRVKKFDCAPRHNKPVNIPQRNQIVEIVDSLKPEVIDRFYQINEFVDVLGKFLGNAFFVNVTQASAAEVDQDDINVNAYYDPDLDARKQACIEILLITHHLATHIHITPELWNTLTKRIADSIAHEMIHMKQYRSRAWEDVFIVEEVEDQHQAAQLHLSIPDEIDAYAYNIASELREHPNPLSLLTHIKDIKLQDSINLWAYYKTFDSNPNHPVIKKLVKKVYKYLT